MLAKITIRKLAAGKIRLTLSGAKNNLIGAQEYNSEKEARPVLADIGVPKDVLDFYCSKLLPRLAEMEELAFPEMNIPEHKMHHIGFTLPPLRGNS